MAWTPTLFNTIRFGTSLLAIPGAMAISNAGNMILDGTTEKLAVRYIPSTTSPITDVAVRLHTGWSGSPAVFKCGVFAETMSGTSQIPDTTTQLGSYAANLTAPAADGWIALQTLTPNNTGNLTVNTPVWIVIEYVSGTVGASDFIQLQSGQGTILTGSRHFNGTDWTTTTVVNLPIYMFVKHADGTYGGMPVTAAQARSSAADIYLNTTPNPDEFQVQGIRFKSGSQIKVVGVLMTVNKAAPAAGLTVGVYEGDTLKYSDTIAANAIGSGANAPFWFTSPVLLAADTNLYIILSQNGGDDTHDYDLLTATFTNTYIECLEVPDFRFVSGSQATITPSTLTVSATELPYLIPLLADPAADLDMAAAGGGNSVIGSGIIRALEAM